ncbi:MAG: type 1 glutamine amidotransferase family protein [Centipeda sp. (in: firmicutes)]
MKTVLLALLEQYADWEAAYVSTAVHMLGQGKFVVKTVSLSKEPITSIGGIRVVPDYTVGSASKDYDALLLIGGLCWREERAQQMIPLVEHCVNSGKVLGGICDAAAFLASIGVLDSVKHTGNRLSALQEWKGTKYKGAENYQARQAIFDRNIITANGSAPLEFAREVLTALHVAEEAMIEDWYVLHKLGYYNTSSHNHFVKMMEE